jgi:uncharacterized YigZ family protein
MRDSYRIVAEPVTHEIPKIKGSRFIASVAPVRSDAEARAHQDAARKLEHTARHHCWAWRVGPAGEETRSSDAGEPSGSAGKPILAAIAGADLTNVSVVVSRYFGGTKLGVGGLVRAYGGAAAAALELVPVTVVVPTVEVRATVPYDQLGILEAFVAREGIDRPDGVYDGEVAFTFEVPIAQASDFAARLVETSSGRIAVTLPDA